MRADGTVNLWDSKAFTSDRWMYETGTFAYESRLANSVDRAIDDIRNSDLPDHVREVAINNLELGNFSRI